VDAACRLSVAQSGPTRPSFLPACGALIASSGLIRAIESIAAYGTGLFGDSVNAYTGALALQHTDVSLPGDNALPVALSRSFVAGT